MIGFWIRVAITLGIILLASLLADRLAGGLAGYTVACSCLVAWVLFQVWHLKKMSLWLQEFRLSKTPTGLGTWDLLFSSVYRLARSYERQQAQLKAALSSFRSATEAMPDGVVALDDHHQIIYASGRSALHLGLRVPEDYGRNIQNLLRHPEFARYLEAGEWHGPVSLHDVPTVDRVLQVQLVPYGESERLLLTRDVTQLERLETTRRDFVANVSHELKTPLTVLAGFLETMQSLPLTPAQQQEVLATMTSQAERMQRIIDDLLILSRLESEVRPPNDSEIDMSAMVERLAREAQYLSRDRHVVRASSEGCSARLLGDDQELASAFGNLVSNAVRYTPEGGEVSISWSCTPEGEGVFCVRDTGPGIESQHIGRLTERFYRVDKGRSRDKGGTGLGLAIVKHIASRHEAELRIQSEVGRGSLFEIVFPKPRVLTASVTA